MGIPPHLEQAAPNGFCPPGKRPRRGPGAIGVQGPLERDDHRPSLFGAKLRWQLEPGHQRGMLPCFRGGTDSRLVRSIRRAWISRTLVSAGSMTSSTYPRSAAM
jgi:hypothetical protein